MARWADSPDQFGPVLFKLSIYRVRLETGGVNGTIVPLVRNQRAIRSIRSIEGRGGLTGQGPPCLEALALLPDDLSRRDHRPAPLGFLA